MSGYRIIGDGRKSRTRYKIETRDDLSSLRLATSSFLRFKARNPTIIGAASELLLCREHNKLGTLIAILDDNNTTFDAYGRQLIELPNIFEVIYIRDNRAVWTSKKIEAENA